MPDIDERFKAIEDALVVMAHLENRMSEVVKEHSGLIVQIDQRLDKLSTGQETLSANLDRMAVRAAETDIRIENLVSAIGAFISKVN